MKNRRGMAVAAAFLAAAALTVGFFLPDLAGRAADQGDICHRKSAIGSRRETGGYAETGSHL